MPRPGAHPLPPHHLRGKLVRFVRSDVPRLGLRVLRKFWTWLGGRRISAVSGAMDSTRCGDNGRGVLWREGDCGWCSLKILPNRAPMSRDALLRIKR